MERKQSFLFLFLLFILLFSIVNVNAVIMRVQGTGLLAIGIHAVDSFTTDLPAHEALGRGNYTNTTSNRPYITINMSGTNTTYVANLSVYGLGGTLNQLFSNSTYLNNDTSTVIYFNGTLIDGLYVWNINFTHNGSEVVPGVSTEPANTSNLSRYYTIIIDTQAPNLTYLPASVDNWLITTVNLTTRSNVFINVSTNDTNGNGNSNTVVGGGYVTFELHNATSGLLNRTVFARNVFFSGNYFAAANLSYKSNNDLVEGIYFYNVSVNDSNGNLRVGSTIAVYKDTTAPNISYNSNSAGVNANITVGAIFVNVSTNDTQGGRGQVAGGFIVLNLFNDTALLNATSFARTVFAADLIQYDWLNISYKAVADLDDGYYWYNVTVNDSLNNNIVVTLRNITIDKTAPNATFAAQGPGTISTNLTNIRMIFINITTNDTKTGKPQVGGGSILFQLRNGTGVLNTTQFELPFFRDVIGHNFINISYKNINDLYEDRYILNYTINDSVGNTYRGTELTVYVDNTSPNISYNSNSAVANGNVSVGAIFINVSTNDTLGGKGQVSGGFVLFKLTNDTGLLNNSLFTRTVFAADLIQHNWINISYNKVDDLDDGYYWYNVTVNDSLGNNIVVTQRNITIDKTAPNATIGSNFISTNLTNRWIFLNVTTNDTKTGKPQSAGGSIIFQIRNGSGVLNTSLFNIGTHIRDRAEANAVNISYLTMNDLYDDRYIVNYTVNDTAGNTYRGADRIVYIDNTAPSGSYLDTNTDGGTLSSSRDLFVNVTTNDTLGGKGQLGGGFVSYYLRNESGVLNWTIRPRNVFAQDLVVSTNLTFSLSGVGQSLSDGLYFFNISVNDTLGNIRWLTERNFTIDTVSPVATIASSEGATIKRLQATTVSCQISDLHPSNITVSIGGESGTFCSNYNRGSSCSGTFTPTVATTKTVTCTAYDMAARSVSSTFDITIEQEDTGGPSSPQSPGGGPRTVTTGDIQPNQPFTMQVPASTAASLGVETVTVLSSVRAPNVKLEISGLSDAPSGVSIPGNVYKYLEIRKTNLADSALMEAVIRFRVTREWLQQNNVNSNDIVLFRLKDGKWERYKPSKVEEADGIHKFEAKVPGFSTFAIGVDKQSGQTPADATTNDGTSTGDNAADTTTEENVEKTSLMPVLVIILVLIVIGAVVWYLVGRKKH